MCNSAGVTDLGRRLKELGISPSKFAKLVGISQPAMRLIVAGANKPRPETADKIESVLGHIHACPACGRAFLEEENDDDAGDTETQRKKAAKE